jgi:hypothetical protein
MRLRKKTTHVVRSRSALQPVQKKEARSPGAGIEAHDVDKVAVRRGPPLGSSRNAGLPSE